MSGFIFVRNVWFRFCTKCLVSLLYEMSGFGFCTRCCVYEMSCVRIVVPPKTSIIMKTQQFHRIITRGHTQDSENVRKTSKTQNKFNFLYFGKSDDAERLKGSSMLAKRFVPAENRGRFEKMSHRSFGLPSTFATIKKFGLVRDSKPDTSAPQTSGNPH